MNEAGTRIVRTAQDHRLTPDSNLMLGEDVHYPGKWSGVSVPFTCSAGDLFLQILSRKWVRTFKTG